MIKHYWGNYYEAEMEDLIGKTFTEVSAEVEGGEMRLVCAEGVFTFFHDQDCCESVLINDIVGDISDLIGSPITMAQKSTSDTTPADFKNEYEPESQTWTFYKLATIKGYVDVRWFGSSNGYYSESVSLKFEPAGEQP